jgi:small subunit ribosomal protein S20
MANIKSAKKRVLRSQRQAEVNRTRISRVRTYIKRVEQAIAGGDAAKAKDALREAQPEVMRGAQKGVLHRNAAARTLSRLSARIKALGA